MKSKLNLAGCFCLGAVCSLLCGQILIARPVTANQLATKITAGKLELEKKRQENGRYSASMKTALGGLGGFYLEVNDRKENLYSVYLMPPYEENQQRKKNDDGTIDVEMPLVFQADLTKTGGKKLKIKMMSKEQTKK